MKKLTHINSDNQPYMVDIGKKRITQRQATAQAIILLPEEVIAVFENDNLHTKKGPVFQTAIIAGVMAVKKTSDLIPLCHPLAINSCNVHIERVEHDKIQILCTVSIEGKTGVEMEALTGATVAALTIYDMCKGLSHNISIEKTHLIKKTGGKSDYQSS